MNTFMQCYEQYSKHGRKIINNKMRFKYNRIKSNFYNDFGNIIQTQTFAKSIKIICDFQNHYQPYRTLDYLFPYFLS